MVTIRDIHNPWRDALQPAYFGAALFHVEAASFEGGRRIVVHEFPKKNTPYAEDMGAATITFTVRGYCIAYPIDTPIPLYRRDYRDSRDLLIAQLEAEGPQTLQLPTLPPMTVVCPQYRWTEEERFGGYCTFDMMFVEAGAPPFQPQTDGFTDVIDFVAALYNRVQAVMGGNDPASPDNVRQLPPPPTTVEA